MSDIVKEIGTIWSRLFDHKAFLNGEIRFTLHEFEEIRSDQEVQNLFALLEKITDIKGTQLQKIKQSSEKEIRSDQEVQNLFALLEKITDIKGTQLQKIKQSSEAVLKSANENLTKSLEICEKINGLEEKYKNDTTLELCCESRNIEWEKFVDDISFTCKRLDNTFEEKEEELQEFYRDLEKKLYIQNST